MTEADPAPRKVPLVNPANAITFVRIVVTPFFVWACIAGNRWGAIAAYLGSSFIDLFDGMIARHFRCESNFGANFDAVADVIFLTSALVTLTAIGVLPLGMISFFFAITLVNIGVRIWYARTEGRTVNYRSYASEYIGGAASGTVLAAITDFHPAVFLYAAMIANAPVPFFDIIQIRRRRKAQAAARKPDAIAPAAEAAP